MAPSSFQAGQPRPLRSGVAPAAVHTESYWVAPLNPASWLGDPSFAEPLNLSATLSPTAASSFNLAPEACRTFGEIGITLEFEIATD